MKEADKWFEFSLDDLDSAAIMFKAGKYHKVCFFAHQAAEKALKGFLLTRRFTPPKIHNLIDLVNLCAKLDSSFTKFLPQARILNQFYLPTRYPGVLPGNPFMEVDRGTAEEALDWAKGIFIHCKKMGLTG